MFQESFIMSKHHFDHLSLTESIFAESVQISSFCNHCIHLSFLCVLVNSSEKYSKCVHVKKSCSFFSQSFFHVEISHLFHAHEKLEQNQIIMKKKKKHLILYLFEFQSKNLHLHHHQQFLKKHDDKLIQENTEIFEEELHILKKKQNFITSSNNCSFNLLISETSTNTIFFTLSVNF